MYIPDKELLRKYAEVIVRVGLNVQKGQKLLISHAPLDAFPLVREVTKAAYERGVRLVDVLWSDEQLAKIRFQSAPRDSFEEFSVWRARTLEEAARSGDAVLAISGSDPELLKGEDPELIDVAQKVAQQYMQGYRTYAMRNAMNWCIVSAATAPWASRVFPGKESESQERLLWDHIFRACRVDSDDPVASWNEHIKRLEKVEAFLNKKQYEAIHFTGPGTDLRVGLPERHVWNSAAASKSLQRGSSFVPNIPTEEVFTMPHKGKIEGTVSSSKPLHYMGNIIDAFSLKVVGGKVTEHTAKQGEEFLSRLLATDEGASMFGEVALVPHSSPISRMGILFYNTLFDENASSHMALGRSYRFCLEGGVEMDEEEFLERGGNMSMTHVDFMLGSAEMDVDGITEEGTREPLMRKGEWAFTP